MPVDRQVLGYQLVAKGGRLDEPALRGELQERGVAAPTERVAVLVAIGVQQELALLEVAGDLLVRILEPHSGETLQPLPRCDLAVRLDRLEEGQTELASRRVVVGAEGRRRVHQARAVAGGDVVRGDDQPAVLVGGRRLRSVVRTVPLVERFGPVGTVVAQALQGFAGETRQRRLIAEVPLLALAVDLDLVRNRNLDLIGEEEARAGPGRMLGDAVDELGMDREAGMARHRPWRRRPGDEIEVGGYDEFPALDGLQAASGTRREEHPDRGILDLLVVLRDLVRGKRRAAAGAIGLNLVPLEEELACRRARPAPTRPTRRSGSSR